MHGSVCAFTNYPILISVHNYNYVEELFLYGIFTYSSTKVYLYVQLFLADLINMDDLKGLKEINKRDIFLTESINPQVTYFYYKIIVISTFFEVSMAMICATNDLW